MQFKIISIAAALTIGVLALPIPNLANEDLVLNPEVPETTPMEKRDIGFTAGSLEARQKYFEGRRRGNGFRSGGIGGGKGGSGGKVPPKGPPDNSEPPRIPHKKRGSGTLFSRSTDPVC
ncbi:hypothetical protein ACEPPN_006135 [Leptodophora sp. 'Broadleaf-Isolate-01']